LHRVNQSKLLNYQKDESHLKNDLVIIQQRR